MRNYDEMMRDVQRRFSTIENNLDIALHDQYVRLARLDLLTLPDVPPPAVGPDVTVMHLSVPVFGPGVVYGPIGRDERGPVELVDLDVVVELPAWRRWLQRIVAPFVHGDEVAS